MKCFLSHSSADKAHYVSIVADKLKPNIEYDELTFEEGMKNFDEIIKAIDRSNIFVLFLSNNSLESDWVKKEITQAEHRLNTNELKCFFPIIIDSNISHKDERIPRWISEAYNLRPISQPTIAIKRIRECLIANSWDAHPFLKKRDQVFVGRNNQLAAFEQRFDDFQKNQPSAVFASGLNEIGRKTTIKRALQKTNTVRDTYEPITLSLTRDDGLEGFILKLNDLGLSQNIVVKNLLERTQEDKVNLCARLIRDAVNHDEVILLEDNYCIVRYSREIADWFQSVVANISPNKVSICIACSLKPKVSLYHKNDEFFFIHIPELEKIERAGLFKRYCDLLDLNLSKDEFEFFIPLLKGYPEQITFAANLIANEGTTIAKNKSYDIASFSIYKANLILKKFEDNENIMDFLRFISSFEFVSIDFLSIIENKINSNIIGFLETLTTENVCETIGSNGNYFRVNEILRDAIRRDSTSISSKYRTALHEFASDFSTSYDEDTYDISEYQIAIREALMSNIDVPNQLLIPAHFLQTMRQLYDDRNYQDVITLADRALQNLSNYDQHTEQDIRYYLCQSLARKTDERFLSEVQKITGPEHDFLLGFYYRLKRRFSESLERYKRAMKHKRTEQRARREIVLVLIVTEDYEAAISLARENFEKYPSNSYLAQAYFSCLMHLPDKLQRKDEIQDILIALQNMGGARASEMYETLLSRFEFEFGDRQKAITMINDTIAKYPDIMYPLLTKLDIVNFAEDKIMLKETINEIRRRTGNSAHSSSIAKGVAVLAALEGDPDRSMRMLTKELAHLSDNAKNRLTAKINRIQSRF